MGAWGEEIAAAFLHQRGFTILERRYCLPEVKGDLDIIAWDKATLVFVEVKTRRSRRIRAAESAVDWRKRRAVVRLARHYRALKHKQRVPWRYDVVSVYPGAGGAPVVEHCVNAFGER
jgi:putative endonuclease